MTHYVHGNAQGRAIVVSHPGIRRPCLAPSPLRESQRDRNRGDGRGPLPPSGNAEGHTLPHRPSGNAEGHTLPHRPSGNAEGRTLPQPLPESEGRAAPHRPSGNPNGIATAGMDVDQSPHPETPKVAPYPIAPPGIRRPHVTPSLRESQRDSAIKPGVAPPRRYPG